MKTINSDTGKTCKPSRIPNSEKMVANQVQHAYDEIANQYEKRVWFDQHILGVGRLRNKLISKASGKITEYQSCKAFQPILGVIPSIILHQNS